MEVSVPQSFTLFTDHGLEAAARDAIALDEPRALLDRFITLVRESGTPDEETAGRYIVERLQALGIPVALHTPDLYISLPERAELAVTGAAGTRSIRARPPAMARSTGDEAVAGEVCYVPSRYAAGTSSLFDLPDAARTGAHGSDPVAGRVVLTEGFSMPGSVQAFERRGAIAQIYIHPGERIHEGICTPIWGAPTLESIGRKPATPVICINHADGQALIADIQRGTVRAAVNTWLREGWMRCLLPVVEIHGTRASATTPPETRRSSSWRGCCGRCAIDCSAACGSPGGRATRPDAMRDPPGTPTLSPTRSTSAASRSSTSIHPAAPMPPPTKK
jgi:N-acetylated-alpha-linked acidic dipeptidase